MVKHMQPVKFDLSHGSDLPEVEGGTAGKMPSGGGYGGTSLPREGECMSE